MAEIGFSEKTEPRLPSSGLHKITESQNYKDYKGYKGSLEFI